MTNTADAASSAGVTPDDFLTPDEQASSSDAGIEETQPAEETTTETSPESEAEFTADAEASESQEEVSEEDQLFAGKFKSLDALKEAFVELGGDPDEYSDPKQLEIAYRAAEKTFHHVRQQDSQEFAPDEESPDLESVVEQAAQSIDWSRVKNTADLVRETIKATYGLVNQQLESAKTQWALDVQKGIEARDAAKAELTTLETKVPRLKTDRDFRDAFGYFVAGQKQRGDYRGLSQAFDKFIRVSQGHAESLAQSKAAQEKAKAQAHVSSDSPEGLKEPMSADEAIVEGIVSASKAKNPLFKS